MIFQVNQNKRSTDQQRSKLGFDLNNKTCEEEIRIPNLLMLKILWTERGRALDIQGCCQKKKKSRKKEKKSKIGLKQWKQIRLKAEPMVIIIHIQ